jgi:glyoxylase-like metal-dependent hydrolase (beta-lactamase superfamily II)
MTRAFDKGLHEISDGVWAYLQPDGSWGWSNAGLVAGERTSLLVDTLFDKRLTREMLDAMSPVTVARPIRALVNTHGNGDHCYGNELVPEDAEIYASVEATHEIGELTPAEFHRLMHTGLGPDGDWFKQLAFGAFRFDDIRLRLPTTTFSGRLSLRVDDRAVELVEVGPAHSGGDVIVRLPDDGIVFTGDILFIDGTPLMWIGPMRNMLAACDAIIGCGAETLVPGHGPLTGDAGVETVKRYFQYVSAEARKRFAAGMGSVDAAFDIDLGEFAGWKDAERVVVNVDALYREWDTSLPPLDPVEMFRQMGRYRRSRRTGSNG